MHNTKTKRIPNTALLFIILVPFVLVFYGFYLYNPANAGNHYLYALQVLADSISILLVGSLWLTILLDFLQPEYHRRNLSTDVVWLEREKPTVDILVPVFREPLAIIRRTLEEVLALDYPHTTYVLDDGDSGQVKELATRLGVNYVARPPHAKSYAKSGNINYGLQFVTGQFFGIFDADFVPHKNFLIELLPFFHNPKIALVQAPQHYTNIKSFIASGTAQAQEIFYKYVQPAKNSYNAAFCVGTNMIYRRSAIDEIGGVALRDHSEDIWTTILLHEKRYESIFFNKILAEGRAPETIPTFFRQQNRWARGGFTLFFSKNPLFIPELTLDQKIQYFFSNIHYFSGFSILIYLLLPLVYLLTNEHPMNLTHGGSWLLHYAPYFITIWFLPVFLLGSLRMATISTSLASFAPYIEAFFSIVLKSKYVWVATETKRSWEKPLMWYIWPHLLIIIVSVLAVLIGWYNPRDVVTTAVTTFWAITNAYFLFLFIRHGIVEET